MHLTMTPQQGLPGQPEMAIHVQGDTITVDGTAYDLSAVPEGGEGWPEDETPFVAPIRRIGGVLHVTLVVRLGDTAAPEQGGPWIIEAAAGDVVIPALRKSKPEESSEFIEPKDSSDFISVNKDKLIDSVAKKFIRKGTF